MGVEAIVSKNAIESRAFYAARRIFGRYGVDVGDPNVDAGALHSAMRRMNAKEYACVIGAFASVMAVNGRMRPPESAPLSEAELYRKLQERARHLKHFPKDLPQVPA